MQRLMEEVQDGKLDFALTKPEDSQVLDQRPRRPDLADRRRVRAASRCWPTGSAASSAAVGPADVLLFLAMLLVGAITIYCFWLVIATLAFWIVAAWNIIELFEGVYQTGRFPVSIYPGWLRFGVTFLVPIAFAITVPAEGVTSRLDWGTVALALGFCVALFAFTRWWWRFGLRHYTGASA